MLKVFRILKIISDDKKLGQNGRNDRVTEINKLLGVTKRYETPVLDTGKNKYVVEYTRPQYWYDMRPITFKDTFRLFTMWHVHLWKADGKSRTGFSTAMVYGCGTRKVKEFLERESRVYDAILERGKKMLADDRAAAGME